MSTNKPSKGIPVASKIPTSGRDSGTHSRSSSVSNLTTASDVRSEAGDAMSENTHGFKLDDRVWVNGTKPGHIKFLGKTEFAPGLWAGILLDDSVGKNDGSVAGVKYFTCEPLRGIFARPSKLSRSLGASDSPGDASTVKPTTPRASSMATPLSSRLAGSTASLSSARGCCSRLRCGERVMVSSTSGMKAGVLRYLGETEFAKGEWAGIELDEPLGKNDGSVAGKRYFNCKMKYGLFSPIHKVSRAGGTSTPRTPSVRGSLMRSTSRDSLSSSVSNSSKASRVKLGVTALTNSQEALKEKEQHIEQLLKEHDMERTEIAKVASRCEELESKCSELLNSQQQVEKDRKDFEQQLSTEKRKIEDLQFQLEEEKIVKSDLELQMSQNKQLINRLEIFLNKNLDSKFINIKEILEGKESSTEVSTKQDNDSQYQLFQEKISHLESNLTSSIAEKEENLKKFQETALLLEQSKGENQNLLLSLNTTIQEKDDVISNLKTELSAQLEKLTKIIEDNKTLNDQINLQAAEAKGQTDEVIKEMGEKIKSLSEELTTKSSRLQECEISLQEKDSELLSNSSSLQIQTQKLEEIENENKSLKENLEQKISDLTEKAALRKSLEEEITTLKTQFSTDVSEKEEKILGLVKELERMTNILQEKEDKLAQNEKELSNLQEKVKEVTETNSQLQVKLNEATEQILFSTKDSSEKVTSLQTEINALKEENEKDVDKLKKELQAVQSDSTNLSTCLEEKTSALSEKESHILSLTQTLSEKDSELVKLQNEVLKVKESCTVLAEEKQQFIDSLKVKEKEVSNLQEKVKEVTETNSQLQVKFNEATEQILFSTKDSSEKVTSLQREINALKEENEKDVDKLKKELQCVQSDSTNLSTCLKEKTTALSENESHISSLTQSLSEKDSELVKLQSEVLKVMESCTLLAEEKQQFIDSLKVKEEAMSELEQQINNLKSLEENRNKEVLDLQKEVESLQNNMKQKNEENAQLNSKLQLAEQNVEMLNKDSSQHVMTLQSELSKLKDENTKNKTAFDQTLADLQNENKKATKELNEKSAALKEKEEALSSQQQDLNKKESIVSDLSRQIEKLEKDISAVTKSKEELQTTNEKQLLMHKEQFEADLKLKETKISGIQAEYDKLSTIVSERNTTLTEQEESILALKNQVKEKENEIFKSSSEIEKFKQQLDALTKEKQNLITENETQVKTSREELDLELKKKEQVIEECQSKISSINELLDNKSKDLLQKESENQSLQNVIKEKESQFDELSKMVEASQTQFKQLNEKNEENTKLLLSKESFVENFKAEKEKHILQLEEKYKTENSKLQELLVKHENDIKEKADIISKLNKEAENHIKDIQQLSNELAKSKELNEKTVMSSGEVNKELTNKIADLEGKIAQVLQEKEKIEAQERESKEAKKNLEESKDSLLQEKIKKEELVKDREMKLEALQAEVNRMKTDFTVHKQELQQKLDVSEMELQAAQELKTQLELQHSVLEELQQDLHNSEEKCKSLECQIEKMSGLSSEKGELLTRVNDLEKAEKEKSEKIAEMNKKYQILEETLTLNESELLSKEGECMSLNEKLKAFQAESKELLQKSLKPLEQENILLKHQIEKLEKSRNEKNANESVGASTNESDKEENEALLSQIDFLNSIIVDMKEKNEKLQLEVEALKMGPAEIDTNLNSIEKKIPPRLFCDICDMFDLHDTDDCPKQESFIADEEPPHLIPQGARKLEERPYCNTCEIFGHWTYDCQEEDEY